MSTKPEDVWKKSSAAGPPRVCSVAAAVAVAAAFLRASQPTLQRRSHVLTRNWGRSTPPCIAAGCMKLGQTLCFIAVAHLRIRDVIIILTWHKYLPLSLFFPFVFLGVWVGWASTEVEL